jgi:hypothetical protein
MPIQNKSAALVKAETLAQVGNRLESTARLVATAKAAITTGIPANESQGTPALTGAEVRSILNPETVDFIESLPTPAK